MIGGFPSLEYSGLEHCNLFNCTIFNLSDSFTDVEDCIMYLKCIMMSALRLLNHE